MATDQTTYAESAERRAEGTRSARTEDIHVRNYAHEWGYDVELEVLTPDGDVVFEADYYLQPGDVESELDAVPAGEYEIRATLDNDVRETARCHVGDAPERTAMVEIGNGVLSLTEGLPT